MTKRDPGGEIEEGARRRRLLGILGGAPASPFLAGRARADGARRRGARPRPRNRPISLDTRLVSEYGVRYPVVNAGLPFIALPELAAAVSNAGGIGMYGSGHEPPDVVHARIADLAARVTGPFGVDFLLATSAQGELTTQDHIDVAAAHRIPIAAFHLDVPPTHWIDQLHAAGTRVWIQVGTTEAARRAAAAGADLIIVQGRSAGGHNLNQTRPTLSLVQSVRAQVPADTLLLAAGGIADGLSLVAALDAGADGAWIGTRFAAATESYAHPEYKARIVAAKGLKATTHTTRFGPECPDQPQRVLANRAATAPLSGDPSIIGTTVLYPGVRDQPVDMPKYSALVPTRDTTGDLEEMNMPAGSESVLWIAGVRPAADIIASIMTEAEQVLARGGDRPS